MSQYTSTKNWYVMKKAVYVIMLGTWVEIIIIINEIKIIQESILTRGILIGTLGITCNRQNLEGFASSNCEK